MCVMLSRQQFFNEIGFYVTLCNFSVYIEYGCYFNSRIFKFIRSLNILLLSRYNMIFGRCNNILFTYSEVY